MNSGVCNFHSTICLLSKCFLSLYACAIYTLPILWNVAFLTCIPVKFHYKHQWHVLFLSCIFSTCCLQYVSILQAGNIFQAMKWLYFLYPPTKGNGFGSVTRHTFTTTQNMKLLHILWTSDNYYLTLALLYHDTVLFTTVLVSLHKKNWLC